MVINQSPRKTESEDIGNIGRLTLVGTPIGNLSDMSTRAIQTLKEADTLLCEDTRRTSILLNHFAIERVGPTLSFHDHSGPKSLEKIAGELRQGRHLAFVSDGGMPTISDPGFALVRLAHTVGAQVTTVPGPSAASAFFAICGLASAKYVFHGFFPRTRGEIEKVVEDIRVFHAVHIFYEAPQRLHATLEVLARNFPKVSVAVGRELTKIHEELLRGEAAAVYELVLERGRVRGECVLGILGGPLEQRAKRAPERSPMKGSLAERSILSSPLTQPQESPETELVLSDAQENELSDLLRTGIGSKEVAKQLSKKFGVSRRVLYDFIVRRLI